MIALTLSSVVIILVSKTFLVQNQYYSTQIQATAAHDNARAATELVASELRSVMRSGITIAGARTLTIRTPMTMVVACYTGGGVSVHVDGGVSGLATDEVAGVARRNEATGAWAYGNAVWSSLTLGGGAPAADCQDKGADTTSVSSEYYRFRHGGMYDALGSGPFDGDVLMLFRETTFSFRTSVMDTTTVGLFRQVYGGSAIEFVTGDGRVGPVPVPDRDELR